MKKYKILTVVIIVIALFNQSCATIYGGARTECQKQRPEKGEPSRALRPGYLTIDIIASIFTFGIPLIVDFSTRAIYKPCHKIETTTIVEEPTASQGSSKNENHKKTVTKTKTVYEKPLQRMGTLGYLNSKNGFKHFTMGTPAENYKNISFVYENRIENTKSYKYNGVIKLGDYTIKKINLVFYKNQLYFISMKSEGYVNSMGILDVFNQAYGKGSQSNRYIKDYHWLGSKVFVTLNYNEISKDAKIHFSSRPLSKELKKEKAARDKSAAGGM